MHIVAVMPRLGHAQPAPFGAAERREMEGDVGPLVGTEGSTQDRLGGSESFYRRAENLPDLLTKEQFAAFLQVSMSTIDNRVTPGRSGFCARCPQPVDIGGSQRWHKFEAVAYTLESPRRIKRRNR